MIVSFSQLQRLCHWIFGRVLAYSYSWTCSLSHFGRRMWSWKVFAFHFVTNSYLVLWEFSTSQNGLLLISRWSIDALISGGNSGDSWVLVHALKLLCLGGVLDCNAEDVSGELAYNSSFFSVLHCTTHMGRRQSLSLSTVFIGYS